MSFPRGGAPVGQLDDLPPVEALAVLCLRTWCEGGEARARCRADLGAALGGDAADAAFGALEDLCALFQRHGRRPLMRHQPGCGCLGADEACFALFVAAASEGKREDALMMAMLLVRPDMAFYLVGLAETFGLAMRRSALTRPAGTPAPRQLH